MPKVIIQVPTNKKLRDEATKVAADYGFSSLQEVLRLFMNKLAQREVDIAITLSPMAEKRYTKMDEDFKRGKNVSKSGNVDELLKNLRGN